MRNNTNPIAWRVETKECKCGRCMDVRLTDEGSTERHFNTTTVGVCKCCGHAFVKSGKQNRKEYCGRPECQKERQRERARRKRQKDKLKAAQDKADKKQ